MGELARVDKCSSRLVFYRCLRRHYGGRTIMNQTTDIHLMLSHALLKAARKAAGKKGFASVEDYLLFLLKADLRLDDDETISAEEKRRIKEKLKRLGYLE